jgi:hypothetical protein
MDPATTYADRCADCSTYHPATAGCPGFRTCRCGEDIYMSVNGIAWYHRKTLRQPCNGISGAPFAHPGDTRRPTLPHPFVSRALQVFRPLRGRAGQIARRMIAALPLDRSDPTIFDLCNSDNPAVLGDCGGPLCSTCGPDPAPAHA